MIVGSLAFALLVAVNAALAAVILALAASGKIPASYRRSIANPLVFLALLTVIFLVDFITLYLNGYIPFFEQRQHFGRAYVVDAFIAYTSLLTAVVIGVLVGTESHQPSPARAAEPADSIAARGLLFIGLGPATLAAGLVLASLPAILAGELNRQLLFLSNPLLLVAFGMVVPTVAIYLSSRTRVDRRAVGILLLAAMVVLVTGSRGTLMLIALVLGVALVEEGRRLPAWLYLPALPISAMGLTGLRFIFRESWKYDSMGEFVAANGGYWRLFFESSEVGLADAFTIIYHDLEAFARPPFESFLGILMYPLPRAIFEFKPVSASAIVTESLSPRYWALTKSEILATGYGDLMMQFGLGGAVIAALVLGFIWQRACLAVLNGSRLQRQVGVPVLIFGSYIVIRGAFFNLGSTLWPLLASIVVYVTFRSAARWFRGSVVVESRSTRAPALNGQFDSTAT